MKHNDPRLIAKVLKEKKSKDKELYQALQKHKAMKKAFRGIYSYPMRKSLFEIGQSRIRRMKNGK